MSWIMVMKGQIRELNSICRKTDPYTHKNQYIHTSILKYLEENISTFTALGCKHKTDKKKQN